MSEALQISVYGDGLCALVTASGLANIGHAVSLHGPGELAPDWFTAARPPIAEPGLAELFQQGVTRGDLRWASADLLPGGDVVFLALDPNAVDEARGIIRKLAAEPRRDWLVINQTSFPVGVTNHLQDLLTEGDLAKAGKAEVVSLPEFLQEGHAVQSFLEPRRLLLGCTSEHSAQRVRAVLDPLIKDGVLFQVMQPHEAEFAKFAITGMLATRISYMNDLANLADKLAVDIDHVREAMAADPRIGQAYLSPGCGFGGRNFSRNVMSLASTLEASGEGSELLEQVLAINERQKEVLFRKLWQHYSTELEGRRVTLWGVAYKPGTARIDNSPALRILEALWAQGAKVCVHDPAALQTLADHYGPREDLILEEDPYAAARETDAVLLITDWDVYRHIDLQRLRKLVRSAVLLDGRNLYDPASVREAGFVYHGVGRP